MSLPLKTVVWVVASVLAFLAMFLRAGAVGLPIGQVPAPMFLVQALAAAVVAALVAGAYPGWRLGRIRAEHALRLLGITGDLRVRHHGDVARVEMEARLAEAGHEVGVAHRLARGRLLGACGEVAARGALLGLAALAITELIARPMQPQHS